MNRRAKPTARSPAIAACLLLTIAVGVAARPARAENQRSLSMEQAVAIALQRNRDVIGARLDMRAAELDKVAAEIYPNPVLSYSLDNLPLGAGNADNAAAGAPARPGFFSQPVQTFGISEVLDVWWKRGARIRTAQRGIERTKWQVADALRTIVYAVRSAFADARREQSERQLSHETRDRYDETIRLSRARHAAGEISEAELRKIELEGLKYQQDAIDADSQYDLAREKLAALLSIDTSLLPASLLDVSTEKPTLPLPELVQRALEHRPDMRAAEESRIYAEASLSLARREALPDLTLGVSYTHSNFLIAGDDPNTLGLNLSLPLPLFDRNQANVGRAELEISRAVNDTERLKVQIQREVHEASRRVDRARTMLAIYEGGMLERAEQALRVAENSYRAGAISLLELLEAQRTFLETRAQYLRAQHEYRQSRVDLNNALGTDVP